MNHKHLWGKTYLVLTQAGFNQALYSLYGGSAITNPVYNRSTLRESVQGYPKKYPSIVEFDTTDMFEGGIIYVKCFDAAGVLKF